MNAQHLTGFVSRELSSVADPAKAATMAAYMKSTMPQYGVPKPLMKPVIAAVKHDFKPANAQEWEAGVRALWALPHREEKHVAIAYARAYRRFHGPDAMPLFEVLIRDGAWWDFVDEVAAHLVGGVWLAHRDWTGPVMDGWIEDPDVWIRRTAILGQLRHKSATDTERLLGYCRRGAPDTSFWIRKAIGWSLRQHAKTDPDLVRGFVAEMGDALSGLSRREALKNL